ncbi:hypothetical protein [Bacillus sp. 103mf]|uniref:hypothetical protein n=1 Tax=unclassified Bacillus (in: firmicutes) TaxID=185979 RepID=UPI0008E2041F|nr:hypothetical protein SAMN04488574_1466 [Bacillus sp. 71mf]SFT20274.1 hypothetical protein SAMN04488145_12020 [Bacillus sp. 103mf]
MPDNDELESKLTYQAGSFAGHVLVGVASILEIQEALSFIAGFNFLALVTGLGTLGAATPIVIIVDGAVIVAGLGVVAHGIFAGIIFFTKLLNEMYG